MNLRYKIYYTILTLVFVSCASYTDQTAPIREAYLAKDFSDALEELEKSPLASDSKSRFLYNVIYFFCYMKCNFM